MAKINITELLNSAEIETALMCRKNAKHPERWEDSLNRYARKVRDKALDSKKQNAKEETEELQWN